MANMFSGMGMGQDPRMLEMMRKKLGGRESEQFQGAQSSAGIGGRMNEGLMSGSPMAGSPSMAGELSPTGEGPIARPMPGGMMNDPMREEALEAIRERLRAQMMMGGGYGGNRMNIE